ncbi:MAG: 4Fe-4S binding protein [Candidatus Methanoperedens sp.]|nr:4Fe-4S binding protein [Candidatus Methanoperedens sp.]MCZ7369048.1 4Fe-4S binding protein [Candidatus Methanoperedens sp.]
MPVDGFITVMGCMKCGKCDSVCDAEALDRIDGIARITQDKCNLCMRCVVMCPNKALRFLD